MATQTTNESASPEPECNKCGFKAFLKFTLLALVAIIGILCIVIAMQPSEFKVSRSATFAASPAAVFEQINDFHKWDAWSPWAKMDPNAKNSFEGPTSGEGAKFSWVGNSDVGEGSMTIIESKPNELVRYRLDFVKPMEGTCDTDMKLEPQGDQTKLTWSMSGKNNFMAKAMNLFMDCEKMVGEQFDKGLADMKKLVETKPAQPAA